MISIGLTGNIDGFHLAGVGFILVYLLSLNVTYILLSSKERGIPYIKVFILSLFIRVGFIFIVAAFFKHYTTLPFISLKDDYIYNEVAVQIARYWEITEFNFNSSIHMSTGFYSGFPNFSAIWMLILGKEWWAPRMGNAILGALTVVYFAKTSRLLYPEKISKLATTLMIFSPVFITYSSLQLKDTLLLFLLMGTIYHLLLLIDGKQRIISAGAIILFVTAMIFVRAATILPILIACISYIIYKQEYTFSLTRKFGIIIFLALIAGGVIYLWDYLGQLNVIDSPEYYFGTRYEAMLGEDAQPGQRSKVSNTSLAYLLSTPLFIAGTVILPIPMAITLPNPESVVNYNFVAGISLMALTPFFVVALINWFRIRQDHKLLIFFIVFFFAYKIGQALSLSIFNLRQSLPAVLCLHLVLPFFFLYKPRVGVLKLILIINIAALTLYAFVRLSSRGLV